MDGAVTLFSHQQQQQSNLAYYGVTSAVAFTECDAMWEMLGVLLDSKGFAVG